jgi:hypothetical protein
MSHRRDVLAGAERYVSRTPSDEAFRREAPGARGEMFTVPLEHRSTRAPP